MSTLTGQSALHARHRSSAESTAFDRHPLITTPPRLAPSGHGASDADSADDETEDAIKDHNEIRDAVRTVADNETGTDGWWQAVT